MTAKAERLHYRCVFDLSPKENSEEDQVCLIAKEVRKWLHTSRSRVKARKAFGYRSFFTGLKWVDRQSKRRQVETEGIIGPTQGLDSWAFRYTHPDNEVFHRQWTIDIGVASLPDKKIRFSMAVSHHLLDAYIGEEPSIPDPTTPTLVSNILRSPKWEAKAGSLPVTEKPVVWSKPEDFKLIKMLLEHEDRVMPVVLLTPERETGRQPLDPPLLAKQLKGTAIVVQASSLALNSELAREMPRAFACHNGSVRVFMPKVNFSSEADARRHRYFTLQQIKEFGGDQIEQWIVNGVARRTLAHVHTITTVDDIVARKRQARIQKLREEITESEPAEKVGRLENLVEELTIERNKLEKDNEDYRQLLEIAEQERDEAMEINTKVRYLESETSQLREANSSLEKQTECLDNLNQLPESLTDVIHLVKQIHSTKIDFTDRAMASAEQASHVALNDAWNILWQMATVLPELFGSSGIDIEKRFQERTGYGLAMTEGKTTKRDKRLRDVRKDKFNSEDIDISPHVKGPNDFRAYFCWHKGKIIVGHFGHLETAGTRRRKEK